MTAHDIVDVRAERDLVATVLADPSSLARARTIVAADHYSDPVLRELFGAALGLADRGEATDRDRVIAELDRSGVLARFDGADAVRSFVDSPPDPRNLARNAAIVRDRARRRGIARALDGARSRIFDYNQSVSSVEDFVRDALEDCRTRGHSYAGPRLPFVAACDFATSSGADVEWIVPRVAAIGCVTELAGAPKLAGKTTFALAACRAVIEGDDFLGRPCVRTSVVYLTEESGSFRSALRRAGLHDSQSLRVLALSAAVGATLTQVMAAAVEEARQHSALMIVIDTLSPWARIGGDDENDSGAAEGAMAPVRAAAASGLAILVLRHERKSGGEVGVASRGSSAWVGAADHLLALRRPEGVPGPRRTLLSLGRLDEPTTLAIERSTNGTYRCLGTEGDGAIDESDVEIERAAASVSGVVNDVPTGSADLESKLCQAAGVSRANARRGLALARERGLVTRTGSGRKGNPWAYTVPADARRRDDSIDEPPRESSVANASEFANMPRTPDSRRPSQSLGAGRTGANREWREPNIDAAEVEGHQ